jgi:hypothetical protein
LAPANFGARIGPLNRVQFVLARINVGDLPEASEVALHDRIRRQTEN